MVDQERPLSPHLSVYRWHITMALSILHRMTGVGLMLGIIMLVWWLIAVASGPAAFELAQAYLTGYVGRALLFLFTFALSLHLLNGVRHLFWDAGIGFDKRVATTTGWLVAVGSVLLTLVIWAAGYGLLELGA